MPSSRVAGLCLVICLLAAPAAGQQPPRAGAYVNVNTALQDGPQTLAVSVAVPQVFEESGTVNIDDRIDGATLFDVSGGVRGRRFAVGVSYFQTKANQAHEFTGSTIPFSPLSFRRTFNAITPALEHRERVVAVDLGLVRQVTDRFDFVVSAGPAFFTVTQELPEDVVQGPMPIGRFESMGTRTLDDSAIGFQGAVNFNYMFHPRIGIGALLRYARGSINLPEGTKSMTLGGFYFGAGARVRF